MKYQALPNRTLPRVLVALAAAAAAALLRVPFQGILGSNAPFLTFYPAVVLAALYGGALSGYLCTLACTVLAACWVLPVSPPCELDAAGWVGLLVFVASCALVTHMAVLLHRNRTRAALAEAKAAEAAEREQLYASAQHLAAIVEYSEDAIIGLSLDGTITSWNDGARRIYGYTAQEAIGMDAARLCLPANTGEVGALLGRVAAGESLASLQAEQRRKDGSLIHISTTLSPIKNRQADIVGVSAVSRDVTDRKRAEEALKLSQRRLLFSQEIAMLGQWDMDLAAGALYWSPGTFALFERDPDSFVPSYEAFMDLVHPSDREAVAEAYARSLADKRPYSIVHRLLMPDGRVKWVREACRHELDEQGNPVRSAGIVQDITELKQAEAALRESELFANAIVENSPDCIKVLGAKGELVYISTGGLRLMALEDQAMVVGRSYMDFWQNEDRTQAEQAFRDAGRGLVGRFEGFCPSHAGTPMWWDVSIAPLRDADGPSDRFLVISRDITERKHAADALQVEKERLETIINTTQNLMYLKDTDLRYLAANMAHLDVLGIHPADMVGKTDQQLLPADQAQANTQSDLTALRYGQVSLEEPHGQGWRRVTKKRIEGPGGKPLGLAALLTDISESRQAYDELRKSEERFRLLVESAPDAIFVQFDGQFAYVNQACLDLYGATSPDQMLGQPVLSRFHEQYHEQARKRIRQLNEERIPVPAMEQRHLHVDGRSLEVEVSAVPIVYHGRNGALVFVRDIAERKKAERLRQDIERITRHDLKAPLNAIINLPLIMLDEGGLSPQQAEFATLIHQAGQRMLNQVNLSLKSFQIEQGSYTFCPEYVDLVRLTRVVTQEIESVKARKGAAVTVSVNGSPAREGDVFFTRCETMLTQSIMENLLLNALEASPDGAEVSVDILGGEKPTVSIRNLGEVPAPVRDCFFDKYTTHGKPNGSGIGTYSARLMARAQGGEVLLNTSEAGATTLVVTLPDPNTLRNHPANTC